MPGCDNHGRQLRQRGADGQYREADYPLTDSNKLGDVHAAHYRLLSTDCQERHTHSNEPQIPQPGGARLVEVRGSSNPGSKFFFLFRGDDPAGMADQVAGKGAE